ncbi:MAG TPA: hypothetical protein DEA62_00330 [Coxiellaceae bacterium]|nr:hypothetical protein [Coxiellaceae bacterium]HBY55579.1 hypothetical protein [Coxiellaceae bacterium]
MKTKKRTILTTIVITLFFCLQTISTTKAAQENKEKPINLKMQVTWAAGTGYYKGAEKLAKSINEASSGRLIITVLPAGALVPAGDLFNAVSKGTVDMAHSAAGYWQGLFGPIVNLYTSAPGGLTDLELATFQLQQGGEQFMQELYAKKNVQTFTVGITGPDVLAFSKKKLESVKDFDGLKMRTYGDWLKILKTMGASPVGVPMTETYSALQKGIVDAAEQAGPSTNWNLGLHEITKYGIFPGINQPATALEILINMDVWNKIPGDLQTIVKLACRAAMIDVWTDFAYQDLIGMENLKNYGMEFVKLTPKVQGEMRGFITKFHDEEAAKNEEYAKALKKLREFDNKWTWHEKILRDFQYE